MAAIQHNGLPRFLESRQNLVDLDDDQYWEESPVLFNDDYNGELPVFLQGDMFQGEDMGE